MGVTEKKAEFHCLAEKSHVWKESGVTTQEKREVEEGALLLVHEKNNVIANNLLSFFSVFKL